MRIHAILTLLAVACSSTAPYVWVTQLPRPSPAEASALAVGDKVQVVVYGQDTLSGEFEVRPGGNVVVPVAGSVPAAGKTPDMLGVEIGNRLKGALSAPRVTVLLTARHPTSVSVVGEVRTPGRYDLSADEGVLHALARAGGLTQFADEDGIYVVRRDGGQRIRFRFADLTAAQSASMGFRLKTGDVVVVE